MTPGLLELPPQPAVVIRLSVPIGPFGPEVRRFLPDLHRRVLQAGGRQAGPHFTRYIRFVGDGKVEVEIGFPVLEPVLVEPPIESVVLPGGTTATIAHFGPHDSLPAAHAYLDAWIEDAGYFPAGPRWEVYVTDSASEPDPSRWSTRLFQPLAPR